MYAIVESGGKQYKLKVGQTVDVERLEANVGDLVELDRVLLVANGDTFKVGKPVLEEARVAARVVEHGKGRKVIVFKYKPKERYRVKKSHRQAYTRLRIEAIEA